MTALDELNAAIDKLTRLRDAAGYHRHGEWLAEVVTVGTEYGPAQEEAPVTNDPLIVTLFDCIDPLLAILRLGVEYGELTEGSGSRFTARALELARAINGGADA